MGGSGDAQVGRQRSVQYQRLRRSGTPIQLHANAYSVRRVEPDLRHALSRIHVTPKAVLPVEPPGSGQRPGNQRRHHLRGRRL